MNRVFYGKRIIYVSYIKKVMKKVILLLTIPGLILLTAFIQKRGPYIDGVYKAKTQAQYTYEPYVGYVTITVKEGWPVNAEFTIVDTAKNEVFNDQYEKNFEGNQHYINQCRNDWNGIKTYPEIFKKVQVIEKVDAISGATWSYNFFKQAVIEALKNAKK